VYPGRRSKATHLCNVVVQFRDQQLPALRSEGLIRISEIAELPRLIELAGGSGNAADGSAA
jgi:hypothetical protein